MQDQQFIKNICRLLIFTQAEITDRGVPVEIFFERIVGKSSGDAVLKLLGIGEFLPRAAVITLLHERDSLIDQSNFPASPEPVVSE